MVFSKLSRKSKLLLGLCAAGALGLLLYFLALNGIGIPCLFRKVTGFLCPGCGNSRAALALLRLDLRGALGYNLLFPLEFFYLGWVTVHCCRSYLRGNRFAYKSPCLWLDFGILTAVLLWWVIRNLL